MGGFTNGRWPLSMLVHLGGSIYLPAGTAARWLWMVALAYATYGVRLRITPGWNGYRPYDVQVEYREELGEYAAWPGTSSHGLIYRGRLVAAIDVQNWRDLADTERVAWARFVALCESAGFTVDFVTPRELWHIGDFNDIWTPPAFTTATGGGTVTPAPIPYHARPYARRKKKTMIALRIVDGQGLLGPAGKQRTFIVGGGLFVDTTDHPTANDVSAIVQGYDSTGALMDTPNLTYRELYDYARGSNALTPAELEPYAKAAGI